MGTVPIYFGRFLDTSGNGSGTKENALDYSASGLGETDVKLAPGIGEKFRVHDMHIHYDDIGKMDNTGFGAGTGLTNGITIAVKDANDDIIIDITDGIACGANADWARYAETVQLLDWGSGNTDDMLTARFEFSSHGAPLRLDGDAGEYLAVTLNDDLSGLEEFKVYAEGVIETETT